MAAGLALLMTGLLAPAARADYVFTVFDPSGVGNPVLLNALNGSGMTAGFYYDSNFATHGFVANAQGQYLSFDAPNGTDTRAYAINGSGATAGSYYDGNSGLLTGFVRSAGGGFTTLFNVPDGNSNPSDTQVRGLNDAGTTAGYYYDATRGQFGLQTGFLRGAAGAYTAFNVAGRDTYVVALNASGATAGYDIDSNYNTQGFVRDALGNVTLLSINGATSSVVKALNASGTAVGYYYDADGNEHGFIVDAAGNVIPVDVPGSQGTDVTAINDFGVVAGDFFADDGEHGFVRDVLGNITVLDPPGSDGTTNVTGINNAGQVAGYFGVIPDPAFLATPPVPAQQPTVPEPATLALFATGLAGLLGCRWRRRRGVR